MQMEKQQKMKNGKGAGIRLKINACILATLVVLVALMAVVIGRASQYNAQYSQILDSISKVTFVKDNASYLGRTVVVKCSTGGDIASSGHVEIIDTMERYVAEVGENVPQEAEYSEMRNQFDKFASEAGKFIASFRELQAACGASYSSAGLNAAQDMSGSMSFVSTSAETLLASEIARSELIVDEIQNDFKRTITMIIAAVVFTAIIVIAATFVLTQSMTAPIIQLQKNLTVMSEGNLTGEDIKVKSRDEAGRAASAFNKMKGSLVRLISKVAANMSELKMATATVNNSVDENAQGGTRIADAVEGMLSALERQQEEVSRAREQISDMGNIAGKVADYAEAIHGNAEKTRDNARDGMQKIVAYVEQMQEVNRSMRDMESVFASFGENTKGMTEALASISSIASQTNLLSLNASIEAARAGEQGKGFAVVAQEIGNLASNSSATARQISDICEEINSNIANVQDCVDDIIGFMEGDVSQRFQEFADIANEYSVSVANIRSAIGEIEESSEGFEASITSIRDRMGVIQSASKENEVGVDEIVAKIERTNVTAEELQNVSKTNRSNAEEISSVVDQFTQ